MANFFLMYNAATSTTGQALGEKLQEAGLDIAWGRDPGDVRYDGLIRWGATGRVQRRPGKILNKGTAITTASDKWEFMNQMEEAGIRIPKTWGPGSPGIEFPCMGRKRDHVGGTDVVRCIQKIDIQRAQAAGCEFFVRYVPKSNEYRLHVFGERIIKASQKVRTNEEVPYDPWVWNLASGFTFRVPDERVPATTRYMAVMAVELAGLDFGAVDIIVGDDGLPYVLEVNTAPGLHTDSGFEAYVKRIMEEFA